MADGSTHLLKSALGFTARFCGVSIVPGMMQFTLISDTFNSSARDSVRRSTALLDALYAVVWPWQTRGLSGPRSKTFEQMVADAQGIRDDRERWIHRAARNEEAAIHHVKIVQIVRAAVEVEHGSLRVFAKLAGADLMFEALHRRDPC